MSAITFLFATRGRIGRIHFWIVSALLVGGPFLVDFVSLVTARVLDVQRVSLDFGLASLTIDGTKADIVISPWTLTLLIPTAIRRLHDRDRSGWRLAAFAFAQIIFYLASEAADGIVDGRVSVTPPLSPLAESALPYLQATAQLAVIAVAVWCFVELACLSGTDGDNRYGAGPTRREWYGHPKIARPTPPSGRA